MSDGSRDDFRVTELDPEILSSSFRFQTNWHVITGASCSGKTTLIDLLAKQGFHTLQESGRQYFERELSKGRTIDEIRGDQAALTRQIYKMMLIREDDIHAGNLTFLDRGLPDALAFFRFAGMDPNKILPDNFLHRYASVFFLDRLAYQRDGVRVGDDELADYYDTWTYKDYTSLGYEVVRVPVLAPEERLSFILENIPAR